MRVTGTHPTCCCCCVATNIVHWRGGLGREGGIKTKQNDHWLLLLLQPIAMGSSGTACWDDR
jgi:hypothetical protein